ncbi:hypothetical protein ES288_D05G252100v1 [Gossypium darwinii]|uniref:Uncharacterized protein n=1 Tax=Gossypium darwinii TaxID=34276 RepID=A0A5D2CLW1_GOSDA|nr:hypothetical protein ES288_D05G252100v1 [Gossypium darwinii]
MAFRPLSPVATRTNPRRAFVTLTNGGDLRRRRTTQPPGVGGQRRGLLFWCQWRLGRPRDEAWTLRPRRNDAKEREP